mmetsp:Transcript_46758/g.124211  ORF Transcript_46758/g.124211 Transcript_46758/m.124211 type:complete len:192 (+) Transcript_46758:264-839(+)
MMDVVARALELQGEEHRTCCGAEHDVKTLTRRLSLTNSETTTLRRANSECDFDEWDVEPWWDVSVDDGEVEIGEHIECLDLEGSEQHVLFSDDFEIDERKFDEVPFPYMRRNGNVVSQPSEELKLQRPAPPSKRELRSSRPFSAFDTHGLEEKYKWRKQFDEPGRSKFKRAVAFLVAQLQPVPTKSEFTPY